MESNLLIQKHKRRKRIRGILFFGIFFVLLCVFRLWFTLFLSVGFALLLTFIQKKRSFCVYYCPIGNACDFVYEGEAKERRSSILPTIGVFYQILFWLFVVGYLLFYWKEDGMLWNGFFRLIVLNFLLAILLQSFFYKRAYCQSFCPLSFLLGKIRKIRIRKSR